MRRQYGQTQLHSHVSYPFRLHVDWLGNYEQARELALKENKLMLVDFSAEWCEPCTRMDNQTWNQWPVIFACKKLVCVRLNFDESILTMRSKLFPPCYL